MEKAREGSYVSHFWREDIQKSNSLIALTTFELFCTEELVLVLIALNQINDIESTMLIECKYPRNTVENLQLYSQEQNQLSS